MTTLVELLDTSLFSEAQSKFRLAIDRCHTAAEQLREAQARQRSAKSDLELEEAQVRMEPSIEWGKNVEERAAQLRIALNDDDDYGSVKLRFEEAIQEAQRWQDEVQKARDELSLYRRTMDWAIVQAKFLTEEDHDD